MATYKNILGDYVITTQSVDDEIVLTSANIRFNGPVQVNGNVSANYFFGDGQFLSNVTANIGAATILQNGTSNVAIPTTNGNVTVGINGTGNLIVISQVGQQINASTISTNQFTGALVVNGGAGFNGNVFAGGVFNNGQAVVNVVSTINGGTY
jgi:hypothetical protein